MNHNMFNTEYKHNNMNKNYYNQNTNNYIVKVNSRDRNIDMEPNPFDFKIKFNKIQGKYTTYHNRGFYDKYGKWITDFHVTETFNINNGAVIEDPIEEVKDINISEIVAPRYIPEDYVGLKVEKVHAVTNPNDTCGVYLKSTDNARITYIEEEVNNVAGSSQVTFKFFKIEDIYGKKFYLFDSIDYGQLETKNVEPYATIKKNYYLFNDYYTDTIMLNNKIYKIGDISNGYIKLDVNSVATEPDFISSELILPKYYEDIIWDSSGSVKTVTYNTEKIVISDNAESLITYDLVKDSIIEIYDYTTKKYDYMKIEKVTHDICINYDMSYTANTSSNTFTQNISKSEARIIKNNLEKITQVELNGCVENIKDKFEITINNNTITIKYINGSAFSSAHTVKILGLEKKLTKIYPNINLTDDEYIDVTNFIKEDPDEIKNTITILGTSVFKTITGYTNKVTLRHLKPGVRDLLNEKLFYLSLEPISPPKNLITNNKLNHVIGTFYPSTQSHNYIFLSGQNRQSFTHRNLKNLNELKFKLYYSNGKLVGDTLKNYSKDYLSLECKQTNLTMLVEQVDRHFT